MLIKGWSSSFQILDRSVDGHDVDFSFRPCIFAIIQRHIGCRFYAPPASYCPERLGSPLVELIEVSARWPRMDSWGAGGGEFVNGDDSAKCFLHFSVRRGCCEVGRGEGGWKRGWKTFPRNRGSWKIPKSSATFASMSLETCRALPENFRPFWNLIFGNKIFA